MNKHTISETSVQRIRLFVAGLDSDRFDPTPQALPSNRIGVGDNSQTSWCCSDSRQRLILVTTIFVKLDGTNLTQKSFSS